MPGQVPWIASPDAAVVAFLFFQQAPEFARLYVPHPRAATIPTHGNVVEGVNAKILWWLRGDERSDDRVVLAGAHLDGEATFEQDLGTASVLPSVVDIPVAGCWTLTIRREPPSWAMTV